MAGDVDQGADREEQPDPGRRGLGGPPSAGRSGSWITRALATLAVFAVVPVFAFAIKYYQDGQQLKRHVSINFERIDTSIISSRLPDRHRHLLFSRRS